MPRHAILFSLFLVTATPLFAADFRVTRTDDPAPNGCRLWDCSLREALIAANTMRGHDRIVLGSGTFNLTRLANGVQGDASVGPLWVDDDTDLVGVGAGTNQTHVRWSATLTADSPVFYAWNQGEPMTVTWSRMKISQGRSLPSEQGGCLRLIQAFSTYTLDQVIVRDCEAAHGGAISATQSTLVLNDSTIEYNHATTDGGGIRQGFGSTLITSGARIRSNSADRDGGGVALTQHSLFGQTTSIWTDDGTTSVTSNTAGRNGGGLAVSGDTSLVLEGGEAGAIARLSFAKNHAAAAGGAISRGARFIATTPPGMDLQRVSLAYNSAANGGGVHAVHPITIDDAELRGNATTPSATNGNGGGLHLQVQDGESTISRSSFWLNEAGTGDGGAVFNGGCSAVSFANVSMHRNTATRGAAIGSYGPLDLVHVTAIDNSGTGAELHQYDPAGSCSTSYAVLANSLIGDRCSALYTSAGGNQYGPDASICVSSASDQRQASDAVFGLAAGTYGGAFTVMGWNGDGSVRPQRDFGLDANCLADDVRGLLRSDGLCDAGAFEQQP